MKLLDKIAINSLVKTITNFILAILKMFVPQSNSSSDKKRRTPILDLFRKNRKDKNE